MRLSLSCFLFLYSIRTAEFCLPLAHLDEALGEVIEIANQYAKKFKQYSLLPIYVRFVKTDDLYLSPANSKCAVDGNNNDHACYIEVQMLNKPRVIVVATTITVTITVSVTLTLTVTVRAMITITVKITVSVTFVVNGNSKGNDNDNGKDNGIGNVVVNGNNKGNDNDNDNADSDNDNDTGDDNDNDDNADN